MIIHITNIIGCSFMRRLLGVDDKATKADYKGRQVIASSKKTRRGAHRTDLIMNHRQSRWRISIFDFQNNFSWQSLQLWNFYSMNDQDLNEKDWVKFRPIAQIKYIGLIPFFGNMWKRVSFLQLVLKNRTLMLKASSKGNAGVILKCCNWSCKSPFPVLPPSPLPSHLNIS